MNKLFRGRRYDTQTAERIGEIQTSLGRSEELFRKRTGEFFLAHWSQWENENSTIEPISYEQAQKWVEKYMDGDDYEKVFGKVNDGEKQVVSMSLDKGTIEKLKRLSVSKGISVSELVCQIIKNI